MMKLKSAAVALLIVGLGAYGASLAAPQAHSRRSPRDARNRSYPTAEKSKSKAQPPIVNMGDYVVEPPDMLIVEVLEALPGRPISGERLVRPDGKISLGFYGDVYVAGLTLPEVKEKVIRHLQKYLGDESLGLLDKDENGKPFIDPATKKPKLSDPRESDRVFVEVTAYNSKNYYVQGEVLIARQAAGHRQRDNPRRHQFCRRHECPGGPQGCCSLSPTVEGRAARGFSVSTSIRS